MTTSLTSVILRAGASYRKAALYSAFALLLCPLVGNAQTASQGFETPATANFTYSATGAGQFFTTADGANYIAGGTRSYGVDNNANSGVVTTTLTFTHVKFITPSTNTLTFKTAAIKTNTQGGLDATGSIAINIAYNRTNNYIPTLKIQGSASNPAWDITAAGTASATVNTATPTLTTVTAANGNSGPGTVTLTFGSAITDVDIRIILTTSGKTDLVIDNVAVSNYSALPVQLTRFDATTKGQNVAVTWATASEKNNERFEVQRSTTGEEFATIGTVKGQGNTSSAHDYDFVDSRPFAGLSYYRLRQVDTDGTSSFSPVAAVQWENRAGVLAYPSPSAGTLTLPASLGTVRYRVFNALGQTLLSGQAAGNDQLDISKLSKGAFFLELTSEAGRTTQRLVRE